MKYKLKPYTIIILILCILVGIYFLWPIITDERDSVLAEGGYRWKFFYIKCSRNILINRLLILRVP